MQNGWETGKNKGNPYPELPLYLNFIYSSGKEPQSYLLNF